MASEDFGSGRACGDSSRRGMAALTWGDPGSGRENVALSNLDLAVLAPAGDKDHLTTGSVVAASGPHAGDRNALLRGDCPRTGGSGETQGGASFASTRSGHSRRRQRRSRLRLGRGAGGGLGDRRRRRWRPSTPMSRAISTRTTSSGEETGEARQVGLLADPPELPDVARRNDAYGAVALRFLQKSSTPFRTSSGVPADGAVSSQNQPQPG